LIVAYPALFGGDSVVRLANADRVLLSYQLPGLQLVIHTLWSVWPSQWGPRIFVVLMSGLAAAGFFRLCLRVLPQSAALLAALLFALNPFLSAYSIVPYQEMLMLAGLAWAFAWAAEGRAAPAAGALALACMARYEAWLACPAVLWVSWSFASKDLKRLPPLTLAYAAGPLAWMAYNGGLTPSGSFAVEGAVAFERLWRWVYLGWITFQHAWFALPAAALGLIAFLRERRWREPLWQALLLLAAAFAIAILLSAHGERGRPERFVTAREAHLPIAGVCLLAALGAAKLRRARTEVALAMLALSLVSAQRFVAAETAAPHIALSRQAARQLGSRLQPGQSAVVLAKPVPAGMLESYLAIAERQDGPRGRASALQTLLDLHTEPPDYQRILVQTPFSRERLRSLAALPADLVPNQLEPSAITPDWALVWSDFEPSSPAESRLASRLQGKPPDVRLEAGNVTLSLYRLTD
jgi:hypothetical protein